MSASVDLDLQQELYKQVRAHVAETVDVTTMPATEQPLPYVFIGPSSVREHPMDHELEMRIETWSKSDGTDEAKQLQHVVRSCLHDFDFTTDDWSYTFCREVDCDLILDDDRETWHGTQSFRVLASRRSFP